MTSRLLGYYSVTFDYRKKTSKTNARDEQYYRKLKHYCYRFLATTKSFRCFRLGFRNCLSFKKHIHTTKNYEVK